ncbi:hypothetical protein JNUCC0626_19760 [Lentzea sp. JNUCC 0626]|uniref:hypothetical protein n=1 Tax=Lentzea sp. JNUCC 0626 TaxID=3367513 RepID=UPI0037497169
MMGESTVVATVCRECGDSELPFTPEGFCSGCAFDACADGDGDRVGLPVPTDLDTAVARLADHFVDGCWHTADVACLVCHLAHRRCGDCDLMLGDMSDSQADEHRLCANELFLAVGCQGYVTPSVRAAALEVLK